MGAFESRCRKWALSGACVFFLPDFESRNFRRSNLPRISSHVGVFPNEPDANNLEDWIRVAKT